MIQVQEEEWVRRTAHNLEDLTRTSGLNHVYKQEQNNKNYVSVTIRKPLQVWL